MHRLMLIHSAAKFQVPHLRRDSGTGARSALIREESWYSDIGLVELKIDELKKLNESWKELKNVFIP
jgi:hypothetical protein